MTGWSLVRWILVLYLALVLAAALLAATRLIHSAELPGLAAIELVLLALPWSLALSIEPTSHLGWGGMVTIVLGGLMLNGVLVQRLARWVQWLWSRRRTSDAA